MTYTITGTTVPVAELTLSRGESVYTQAGGMIWQTDGIAMETSARGGLLKGLSRMFGGESFFMASYTAREDGATVAFAAGVPGSIWVEDLTGHNGLIAQKGCFLCAEQGVELSVAFTKKFSTGLFSGEGFILQDLHGQGKVFLEIDGDMVKKTLAPGEVIKVSAGNVVAFEKTVQYELETIKGAKNTLFGGEGLFLTKLTGPGTVILQTMSFSELAAKVIALIPPTSHSD